MELNLLLDRCRKGDELAWEMLVRQFQGRVFALAYHYAGNREDAQDLAQDVFVRVYNHLSECGDASYFRSWLIRVARNSCIDHLRRRKTRPSSVGVPVEQLTGSMATEETPEEVCASQSRSRLIHRALWELTELNREIIVLKEIHGLPFDEVAEILDIPVGTAKSRSSRAKIELAERVLAMSRRDPKPNATLRG